MKTSSKKVKHVSGAKRPLGWLIFTPLGVYAFLLVSGELWGSTPGRVVLLALIIAGLVIAFLRARR